jgi:hypothetical protein
VGEEHSGGESARAGSNDEDVFLVSFKHFTDKCRATIGGAIQNANPVAGNPQLTGFNARSG